MTLRGWLDARVPKAPPALDVRVRELLAGDLEKDERFISDAMLQAVEQLLTSMLASGSERRDSALDLLAADALVTYAFEVPTADAAGLAARADRAMHRIAALGVPA